MRLQRLLILVPSLLSQWRDNLSQREQRLVNVYSLFGGKTSVACLRIPFTSSQINQLQFRNNLWIDIRVVSDFSLESKNSVRPRTGMIQIVTGDNFVFDALVVHLNCVLRIIAAENKQIFYSKLVIFWPTHFQALIFHARLRL